MQNLTRVADFLAQELVNSGRFRILSSTGGKGLPLVAFCLKKQLHFDEFSISSKLRERGWIVPAYSMAPKAEHLKLLRIVVREDLTVERCTILLRNLNEVMKMLDSSDAKSIEELHKSMHNWNLLESSVKSFRRTNASGVC